MENSAVGFTPMLQNFLKPRKRNAEGDFSLLVILYSIGTYLYDVVSDILLVGVHYRDGKFTYFCLTLIFVLVPAVTMTCFSLRFYLNDDKKFKKLGLPRASTVDWVIRAIFLIFQTGPILRYIDTMRYNIKARQDGPKQTFYVKKMICERSDASFLRLIESFSESAPQFLLQLYIIVVERKKLFSTELTGTENVQLASMFASLISMSFGLVAYHRSLRITLSLNEAKKKIPLSWSGTIVMFLWHFFEVGSRVLALGLFLSVFPVSFAIVCVAHCGIMLAWIISMKTDFCETRCEEIIYNVALAVVFLFCYFNPKDTPTRWKYVIFYSFIFVENSVLMAVWYTYADASSYKLAVILIHFLGFAISIALMVIYYLLLHPTQNIHVFTPSAQECSNSSVKEGKCDSSNGPEIALHSIDLQDQHENCTVKDNESDNATGLGLETAV